MSAKKNIAILIYPGVEMVDMNGPADVFIKANNFDGGKYNLFTVAESADPVKTEAAVVTIIPAYTLENCPAPDIIVIPGQILSEVPYKSGSGSDALVAWLAEMGRAPGMRIVSVCVGAFILARTGLLEGKEATTHYQAIPDLQQQYPGIRVVKNVRCVQDGNIITTGGITSGIDGALHLVGELDGAEVARKVADEMVYNVNAPLPPGTILKT